MNKVLIVQNVYLRTAGEVEGLTLRTSCSVERPPTLEKRDLILTQQWDLCLPQQESSPPPLLILESLSATGQLGVCEDDGRVVEVSVFRPGQVIMISPSKRVAVKGQGMCQVYWVL